MFIPKTEHVFRKNGASQNRWQIFPKSVADFFQSRISSKSVADFPKAGGRFSQSRWQIFPKSVTDFLKVGGRCSQQSRWQFCPKSVSHFSKSVTDFPKNRASSSQTRSPFSQTDSISLNPNQIFTETSACFSQAKYSNPNRHGKCSSAKAKPVDARRKCSDHHPKAFVLSTNKFLTLSLI